MGQVVLAQRVGRPARRRRVSAFQRRLIRARQGGACDACAKPWEPIFQIDHIVPLRIGGSNRLANLHALCPDCHARKTAREPAMVRIVASFRPRLLYALCFLCGAVCSLFFDHRCDDRGRCRALRDAARKR
jgi:hypothetical protein